MDLGLLTFHTQNYVDVEPSLHQLSSPSRPNK